jgi:tetratricopeptide (TPR) repeat protein
MPATHLTLVTLERFAASDLDPQGMVEAGRHLSSCTSCRERLRGEVDGGSAVLARLARKGWPEDQPSDYDEVFERLQIKAMERIQKVEVEREIAPRLADELLDLPPADQQRRIREDRRFRSAALAALLLDRSSLVQKEDLSRAEVIARLALEVASQIEPEDRNGILACDLQARAWAYIANSRRILCDFRTAETAIAKAESLLEEGSGDPLEKARVLDFKASLLRSLRRLDAALSTIDQVISIYRRVHESHRQGRALLSKAVILGHAGQQERGIALFFQALELIDAEREPRLVFVALNNLFVDLTESGRYEEARSLLPELRQSLDHGTQADRITELWAEAKLESGLGQEESAEVKLHLVRDEFLGNGLGYDAALASLDLALLYLGQGRTEETRHLAAEMHTIFVSREIHREALVALVFFQQAAEQERATVQMVKEVSTYLRRAHGNPTLSFEIPT